MRLIDITQAAKNPEILEDELMFERPLTEFEIAEHTVMLTGLPKSISVPQVKKLVFDMFSELLKKEQVFDE
jgi:hypothetical protein